MYKDILNLCDVAIRKYTNEELTDVKLLLEEKYLTVFEKDDTYYYIISSSFCDDICDDKLKYKTYIDLNNSRLKFFELAYDNEDEFEQLTLDELYDIHGLFFAYDLKELYRNFYLVFKHLLSSCVLS